MPVEYGSTTRKGKRVCLTSVSCARCGNEDVRPAGHTSAGKARYYCKECGFNGVINPACDLSHSFYKGIFKKINTIEKAYWLGLLTGDGCIGIYDKIYRMNINLIDREPLVRLALFLGYPEERVKTYDGFHSLQLTNYELVKDLIQCGLMPRKARKLTGSIIPKGYEMAFIRGLFDADGCVGMYSTNDGNRMTLKGQMSIAGNYPLLKSIKQILTKELDVRGSLHTCKNGTSYLSYGGRWNIEKILASFYAGEGPYLERKHNIYLTIKAYNAKHPKKIPGGHKYKYMFYKNGRPYAKRICFECGSVYLTRADHAKRPGRGRFCSIRCAAIHNGRKRASATVSI